MTYILVAYEIDGETRLHFLGGFYFPIFQTYPLNNLIMDTKLIVDLG